jgi:predicted dehydrogenase
VRNLLALGEKDLVFCHTGQGTLPLEGLDGFPVEVSLEDALAHDPDAAIICTPTSLHLESAIPAAKKGCHLLLEKPVSHSLAGTADLLKAVRESGSRVLVGYHYRFHPGIRQIKKLIDENEIGRVVGVQSHWGEFLPGWHPWEDYRHGYSARRDLGGGVLLTLSHPLDYLCWFFGDVNQVIASLGKRSELDFDVEDTADLLLTFASGVSASVHLNYWQMPASHTLEIGGARGTIHWDNQSGEVTLNSLECNRQGQARETVVQRFPPPAGFERNDIYLREMRHFIQVVRGEAASECTLEDGLRALGLAMAAGISQEQGKRIYTGPE